jgi:ferredoxin
MIVGKPKPIEEVAAFVSGFRKVLILGCGTCVTVCLTGGEREARLLARELIRPSLYCHDVPAFEVRTVERQCERDMVRAFADLPRDCDAVLSLACGAGVQTLASILPQTPVLPALNTTFLGALDEPGVWREKCYGCGECVLAFTAGICPVARCAKRLLNGPCGGSRDGKCEISRDVECAWALIVSRLTELNRLDLYERVLPPKDWSADRGSGPRVLRAAETP